MSEKFSLGRVVITRNAMDTLAPETVHASLARHHAGDWGDLCQEDLDANQFALDEGLRLLSSYEDRNGRKFWIITEADRSATTVLLPEDY
jgi:hypothetical protein